VTVSSGITHKPATFYFLLFWSRGAWNVWRGGARPCGDFATKGVTKNNIKSFSRTLSQHTHTHTTMNYTRDADETRELLLIVQAPDISACTRAGLLRVTLRQIER
jgi:hypothetical protein